MAPRAVWKGSLKVAELSCPVSLYTAVSTSDRIAFHTLNRETGHRIHRQFVDGETGKPVPREDQVKGYEVSPGEYVTFDPEEVAAAVPESDKTLAVQTFIACETIDDLYLDRPYYLAPSDKVAEQAFTVLRDGMRNRKVAALAQTVLFRRMRTVLIRAHDEGLIATLLNFDYEVRSSKEAFDTVPALTIKDEMLDLAKHIIKTKMGSFDPKAFDDRYEVAVAEMVRAKIEGRPMKPRAAPAPTKVSNLLDALRESAGAFGAKPGTSAKGARTKSAKSTPSKPAAAKEKAAPIKSARAVPQRKAG